MDTSDITLFSGLAVEDILEESVLPVFRAESDVNVTATYEPTKVLRGLIDDGARPDVMLGVGAALAQLVEEGVLAADTLTPLVRSGVGLAVPPGTPLPDIRSVDELVATLRRARAVAYSRTGASGEHFATLLDRLGIADEVNAKACILEKGFTARALLDGRADLAVQQIIELKSVPGVHIVGPLPPGVQHYVELSVAAATGARPPALALLRFLRSELAADAYSSAGLELAFPRPVDSY